MEASQRGCDEGRFDLGVGCGDRPQRAGRLSPDEQEQHLPPGPECLAVPCLRQALSAGGVCGVASAVRSRPWTPVFQGQ